MKVAADRTYTGEFRDAAVKQVIDGVPYSAAIGHALALQAQPDIELVPEKWTPRSLLL